MDQDGRDLQQGRFAVQVLHVVHGARHGERSKYAGIPGPIRGTPLDSRSAGSNYRRLFVIRHAIAGAVGILLIPAALAAQTTIRIETASTDVREAPTAGARFMGQVHRGRVLEVTREDGDWVAVVWPEATACVGYVPRRAGVLDRADSDEWPVSDARADVDAVERAVWAIWAARFHATMAPHGVNGETPSK
jgi:hypothetical protein